MNYVWFVLLASFWGGSFVAIKIAIVTIPPFLTAFFRVALSLVILRIIFYCLRKNLKVPTKVLGKILLIGLFTQGIPFAFLF